MTCAGVLLADGDRRIAGEEHHDLACHQLAGRGPRLTVQALRNRWRGPRSGPGVLAFVERGLGGPTRPA
jgi:hypothetical protein